MSPAAHATHVHRALWRLADGAEVCATMEQIAHAAELGEHVVRRSLASLVERGQIVPAGKRGKTSVFRLSPSTPGAETPLSRRDSPQGGSSSSTNERSTAHSDPAPVTKAGNGRRRRDSAFSAEEQKWLDEFKFTPELCAEYAALARAHAARYSSRPSPPAVLQRRGSLRDKPPEWPKGHPDISERYFERPAPRRADIWLPPGSRNRRESAE